MPKTRTPYKYQKRDASVVREHKTRSGSFDTITKPGLPVWKPEAGKHHIRILPPTFDVSKQQNHWGIWIHTHFGVGPDNSTYLCLRKHQKSSTCPMCDFSTEILRQRKADGDDDRSDAMTVSKRLLCWVIVKGDEETGPQLFVMPESLDAEIASQSEDDNEILYIDDPDEGYWLKFEKKGQGLKTRYGGVKIDRDPSPISKNEDEQAEWMAYIQDNPLPSCLNFYEVDYIESLLDGQGAKKGSDDDEDDKPRRSKRVRDDEDEEDSRSSRSRAASDADEQGEDEDGASLRRRKLEDDDEPPRRGRRAARDEEEDDSDQGDDEDETPPRRRSKEDDDDEDDKPRRSKRVRDDEDDEDEDVEEPPRRRKHEQDDDADDDDDVEEAKAQVRRRRR